MEHAPNVQKKARSHKYIILKKMNETTEIKEWATNDFKGRVAQRLMTDRVRFAYDPEQGMVFTAPEGYVKDLVYKLMVCDGARKRPNIYELNK
jgi:hypothetical protein